MCIFKNKTLCTKILASGQGIDRCLGKTKYSRPGAYLLAVAARTTYNSSSHKNYQMDVVNIELEAYSWASSAGAPSAESLPPLAEICPASQGYSRIVYEAT